MKEKSIILPLILILFMATAIPSVLVLALNNHSMRKSSEQAIADSAQDALAANQKFCDELFSQYIYAAMDFILDRQYVKLNDILTYQELNSDYENVMLALEMNESMKNIVDRNRMIHSIFFYIDDSDYVVATNGGIQKLENYEDMNWLLDILERENMLGGVWYPRELATDSGIQKTSNLLSYVYRSNSLSTSSRVTIVINVYEEDMSKLVFSREVSDGSGYLVDGAGNVIVHSDTQGLYGNISQKIGSILTAEEDSGIIRNGNHMYIYRKSQLYDWIYINEYDSRLIFSESSETFRIGLVTTLIVIFMGVLLAVFCAWKIYQPVRRLVNEMKMLDFTEELTESKNEMTYLSNALTQIKEKARKMESHLEKNEKSVRQKMIYDLMQGEEILKEQAAVLERYFVHDHFMVCILLTDDEAEYLSKTQHEERAIIPSMIFQYLQDMFADNYRCECVRYGQSVLGVVINFENYDSARVTEQIQDIMQKLQIYYKETTGFSCTVGISLVHNYLQGIQQCTREAYQAAGRRLVSGKGQIHFASRLAEQVVQTYDFYQNERRIMNYLEIGNRDMIYEELSTVVENIKELKDISEDNIMLVFNQMIGDILTYLNRHNYNVNMILQEKQTNLYSTLAKLETLDEIQHYLEQLLGRILDFQMQESQAEGNSDYDQQIINYIRRNYQVDIDFEKMAEDIGISYSYARKIMKSSTGKSLIEYLSLVRVGEAKRLLEVSDLSMVEIAEKVGYHNVQSLYRFFKKYEGISPSTYKEELRG